MKLLIYLAMAGAMLHAQTTITDTIKTPMGGNWSGTVVVTLNNPATAQPLYSGSETLSGWSQTVTVTNGAFSITLYPNDAITPTGTSYTARYSPTSGAGWSETWVVPTGATTIRELRSTTVPTPRTMFTPAQITQASATLGQGLRWNGSTWAPGTFVADPMTTTGDIITRNGGVATRLGIGSTGQLLGISAGLPAWVTLASTGLSDSSVLVRTSATYADPSWITSLAGSKVSGAISGNAATATALQTARTIAGVSFNGTANISIPSSGLSDGANITLGNSRRHGNRTIFIGDSITAASGGGAFQSMFWGPGWVYAATFAARGSVQLLWNAGISGNTTTQMSARFAADVVANNPDVVVILGGTNDVPGVTAGTTPLATVRSNLQSMVSASRAAGILPVLCLIPPRADTAPNAASVQRINAMIRSLAQQNDVTVVDFYSVLVNPSNGGYASGLSGDGIHPSASGMTVMANKFLADTVDVFGPSAVYQMQSANDPLPVVAGGMSLSVPFMTYGYGSAPAATVGTASGGTDIIGNWTTIAQPSGTGFSVISSGSATTGFAVGDLMAFSCRIQTTGLTASGGRFNLRMGDSNYIFEYPNDVDGLFYNEIRVPAGTTSLRFEVVALAGGSGAYTLRFGQCAFINLTANAL